MANRLAKETSPYLRQHQDNLVDWYPWGEEALARARAERKPILLSIGYSACHWCHVMAHESFENPDIAKRMNDSFVNIKVDREERPDLDQIYQTVAQLFTKAGGWPLTVFLTPELKPYFGGTYFPPKERYGRPGFGHVVQSMSEAFAKDPKGVEENARRVTETIRAGDAGVSAAGSGAAGSGASTPASAAAPTTTAGKVTTAAGMVTATGAKAGTGARAKLKASVDELLGMIDVKRGGFGDAPKFPNAMALSLLWRYGTLADLAPARDAVLQALECMARGGIYDQLAGGFHRYSVDGDWAVPHFEKMLYDNGLLLRLYSEVLLAQNLAGKSWLTPERELLFLRVVQETTEYLLRDMISPEGAFYSAQDADSEGEEGKYFVWDPKTVRELTSEKEAQIFGLQFGLTAEGNFQKSQTVLSLAMTDEEIAAKLKIDVAEVRQFLIYARRKVMSARAQRVKPVTDDKILTAWNALAISGLAWAGAALRGSDRQEASLKAHAAARKAYSFLKGSLQTPEGRLRSTYHSGQSRFNGYLDDYAYMAQAALDLARFEASDETAIELDWRDCQGWIETVIRHFSVAAPGAGYYFTSDDHEKLIHRPFSLNDQAIPAGTAVALECLAALAERPNEAGPRFAAELERQWSALGALPGRPSFGSAELVQAMWLHQLGPFTVSGARSRGACAHPWVFRTAAGTTQAPGFQVCHRQTCMMTDPGEADLRKVIWGRLVSALA